MSDTRPDAACAEPLLLELARVRRVRQFYEQGHPKLVDALARAATLINGVLPGGAAVDLELRDGVLALPGGRELRGPGLDELADDLEARDVARLRVCAGVEESEILALAEALTESPAALRRAGGLERSLRESGVERISLPAAAPKGADAPEPSPAASRPAAPLDERTEPMLVTGAAPEPGAQEAPPEVLGAMPRARTSNEDTPPPAPPSRAVSDTVALVRKLGELEACDDLGRYAKLSEEIRERVRALLERKRCFDAYRALLVYCRHSADPDLRPPEIFCLAEECLRDLMSSPELLEFVIEHACTTSGLTSVQATQVLVCYGASAAEPLLARHAEASRELQRRTTSILIAMGQSALPAIVDELSSRQLDMVPRPA